MNILLSIIIPHKNDSQRLSKCLEALNNQNYPRDLYEIIVIDNGSNKKHKESLELFVSKYDIVLLDEKKEGSYSARNTGLRNSKGNYIAFTDADCIPNFDWIRKGLKGFHHNKKCGLLGGNIKLYYKKINKPNIYEIHETLFGYKQSKYIDKFKFAATANVFTSMKIINDVGNFNEDMFSSGDREWGVRVHESGYKIVYDEEVIIKHPARNSFKQLLKKRKRTAGGEYLFRRIKGQSNNKIFIDNTFSMLRNPMNILNIIKREDYHQYRSKKTRYKVLLLFLALNFVYFIEIYKCILGSSPKNC